MCRFKAAKAKSTGFPPAMVVKLWETYGFPLDLTELMLTESGLSTDRAKVEELILSLGTRFTVVIVTHNMQQAMRVSDLTALFYLGSLIEYRPTMSLFDTPRERLTQEYVTGRFG
jgi:hypothetical protein